MKLYALFIVSFSFLFCIQQDAIASNYDDKSIDADAALYEAISKSEKERVCALLAKGANPNSKSPWGDTNLGSAVMAKKTEVVEILLKNGANPNLKGDPGSSLPLCYAIANRDLKMVQLLLAYKADPSCKHDDEDSPIRFAQMILGYPSLEGDCHPILAELLKALKKDPREE